MDDDLRRRLEALDQRLPEGRPDPEPVIRDGRKLKVQRAVLGSVGVLLVAAVTTFGVAQLVNVDDPQQDQDLANHEDGVFTPAERGEATYELFNFEIRYPWAPVDDKRLTPIQRRHYCSSPRGEWDCSHRHEQAALAYEWRWTTKKYPGQVQCRGTLFGKDGSVVGREEWGLSGLEPQSRRPLVAGFHVSARPVEAEAVCEAGAYKPGPGFDITFVRAEAYTPSRPPGMTQPPDRIRLVFEVDGTVPHADSRFCRMTVWLESGVIKQGGGTMNLSDGPLELETGYPASEPVEDAEVKCRAIRASDTRRDHERRKGGSRTYGFSDLEVRDTDEGSKLTFISTWEGQSSPGSVRCFIHAETADGPRRFGPFSFQSADRRAEGSLQIPVEPDEITQWSLDCK